MKKQLRWLFLPGGGTAAGDDPDSTGRRGGLPALGLIKFLYPNQGVGRFAKSGSSPRVPGELRWRRSNSRPSECDSSWFAHFDSDKMMRYHRDVEKDLRYGLLEPEPARFWRSSACFGS